MSGLADFEILDRERTALKQLHAGLQRHFHKAGGRENDVRVHLVILEESHVAAVEARRPSRRGARQADVEQAFAAGARRPSRSSPDSCHQRLLSHG